MRKMVSIRDRVLNLATAITKHDPDLLMAHSARGAAELRHYKMALEAAENVTNIDYRHEVLLDIAHIAADHRDYAAALGVVMKIDPRYTYIKDTALGDVALAATKDGKRNLASLALDKMSMDSQVMGPTLNDMIMAQAHTDEGAQRLYREIKADLALPNRLMGFFPPSTQYVPEVYENMAQLTNEKQMMVHAKLTILSNSNSQKYRLKAERLMDILNDVMAIQKINPQAV